MTKNAALAGISLLSLSTLALGACSPSTPNCRAQTRWDPDLKMCIANCGTPEHPTYEGCYVDGSYIGSDASEAGALDVASDAGVATGDTGVSQPDADAAMEAGPMCASPSVLCGGTCVVTASDPAHCGGCNRACTTMVANARATCAMSTCDFECLAGFELVGASCEARVPRPIAPMTSATVTSQRPTLEWELPSGVTMATVDVCRDRAMTMGCVSLSATGSRVRPTSALTAGVWFWRVRSRVGGVIGTRTSPVWWFRVGHADAAVDTFHGVELDVNGDGYGDVAVGAPDASPGGRTNAGVIYLFLGSPAGLASAPTQIVEGVAAGDGLGTRLGAAGDVNGDGLVDLIAARPGGFVDVYVGALAGVRMTPISTLSAAAARHGFGASIAAAGDVDGDGYGDIVVGAASFDDLGTLPPGTASIHQGSLTGVSVTPLVEWMGTPSADYFGWVVAGAGDVNGDRLADVVVGEYDARDSLMRAAGAAHLFVGRRAAPLSTTAQRIVRGSYDNSGFGGAVLGSSDVNGDGYSDLLVAAHRGDALPTTFIPVLYAYLGSADGAAASAVTTAGITAGPGVLVDAGDMNHDGRSDVLWSNAYVTSGEREVGQILLMQTPTSTSPLQNIRQWYGQTMLQQLGTCTGAADVNGDGWFDLLATDQTFITPGRLHWFVGGAAAPASAPMRTYTSAVTAERFGVAMAQ